MSTRELLDKATARPWHVAPDPGITDAVMIMQDGGIIADLCAPENAALIVAAVNEHEALSDIAEAASDYQDWAGHPIRENDAESRMVTALSRLDAIRGGTG